MRFALMLALLIAPVAVVVAAPDAALAAEKKKPKKTAVPKAKTNGNEKKTVVKEKEPASEPKTTEAPAAVPPTELRGPTRIDFDDRLIQGQTNKSGAVYLFDRKETGISSMVRRRKSFRQLTLSTIYDR
jgi:hypothetical protein